jgi:hypothetical protein
MNTEGRSNTFYRTLQQHAALTWYPISISIVMFWLFSTFGLAAGQVQEALANYVEDQDNAWRGFAWLRAAITFFAIFIFASTLRYWTARLLGVKLRGLHTVDDLTLWQKVFIGIAWFAPWLGAALSFADAALAMLGAQAAPERSFAQDFMHLAKAILRDPLRTPFVALALAAVAFPIIFLTLWWSPLGRALHRMIGDRPLVVGAQRLMMPSLFMAFAALFFFMPRGAIEFARVMGPIPIICVSFAVITAAGSYLIYFGRQRGLPTFPVAVLTPMLLGAMGLDDNHHLRRLGAIVERERPNVPEALLRFQSEVGGAREPIILVSAEGGGIRAAHFTATVLSRLADQCPPLARRIFLISGVSGGAVGAAAYRASLEAMPLEGDDCDLSAARAPGPRQRALNAMFSRDHLSPALAKQMFPELIQNFAPAAPPHGNAAFFPQTDRQLGLELSLEEAFTDAFDLGSAQSPFAASVFGPENREPAAPHLLINMTEVSSGGDFVVGPLDLADVRPRHRWLHDFRCLWSEPAATGATTRCARSPDFRLSTMAVSSARFPIVSPAGSVRAEGVTLRFVDGGYFDNSGVETLLGVIEHLQMQARETGRPLPPLAVLHIDSNPYVQRLPVKWRLDFDVHELQAVLTTREERVRTSLGRLYNLYQDDQLCSLRFVEVLENDVPLRLGWILSTRAANDLQTQAAGQLATAFAGAPPPLCDGATSSDLHAAIDRYAERLAMNPAGGH